MKLRDIYKSDINRDINGVVKVAQDDEQSLSQELGEYVITKELRKHFNTFLDNYERSLTHPTDKIGVWISGFFGSGKSHFLKMLSYLLSNKEAAGKKAADYFYDKFDDPMMFAQLERCASVPTDTILFNIDSKSSINKDKTAILRVFAKVFYEHLGFYGEDLKFARLEQFIAKSGKMKEFQEKFLEIHGDDWRSSRDAAAFFEDDVVETLVQALGMSEASARNWFNGTETADISISQLVKEIKEYIDSKSKNFRLLFMIDEVGQYIGSDSDLMLNLQTIVEEIGTKCGGRVWVMVTSQEAIDSITKISGDDFSKIQGRFNTRLSLSSSSVDEVIQKRILAKNENGELLLRMNYEKNSAVLRNLFIFRNAVLDLKGYTSEEEYVITYPFVPYQFRLMQNVLAQIRKHGNSGKHLSGGERSMLSGFQEVGQKIQDRDENALVPFYLFYDTVHTFLESTIRRVIDRCQTAADQGDGIEQYDVHILKLLYLIRYIDDLCANLDNIATLMVEEIDTDKIVLRQKIQGSLDRLLSQNYVAKNGDTYTFLTDDEQDIAREIRNTMVDSASMTHEIAQRLFSDIYQAKKYHFGKYDFSFDRIVDETVIGQLTDSIRLHIVTAASDLYGADVQSFIMKSATENEAIVVLSDQTPYFQELESAMKIRRYIKSKNVSQLPPHIQEIIRLRQQQAAEHEKKASELISQAIVDAQFYVNGEELNIRGANAKEKLDSAMKALVESVYTKLALVRDSCESDSDLRSILTTKEKQIAMNGITEPNAEAIEEIEQYLERQSMRHLNTSMGDVQKRFQGIPYGWREMDIASLIATLIADQKIQIQHSGEMIQPSDARLPAFLYKKAEIDKTLVIRRVSIDPKLIQSAREFLKDYFDTSDVPSDEDSLIEYIITKFQEQKSEYTALLQDGYAIENAEYAYPGKKKVEHAISLCDDVLSQRRDNTALIRKIDAVQDDLLDSSEDLEEILTFFKSQRTVFDSAVKLLKKLEIEADYLRNDTQAQSITSKIKTILTNANPYRQISNLPELIQELMKIHNSLLAEKKAQVTGEIQAIMAEIHQSSEIDQQEIVRRADSELDAKKQSAVNSETLTELDAMRIQIDNIKQRYLKSLIVQTQPNVDMVTANRSGLCMPARLKNEEDVNRYVADLKERLLKMLDGHDTLHIL